MSTFAFARGGLLAIAVLVLYAWLAPTYIVDADNAHFATLGAVGGVAHPTGYPLYVLWLRAWSWLPGATPAQTAALATTILAAIQVLVLHAACRAWGARVVAATVATGVLAAAPAVMRMGTEAEVFAMNGVVVAGVLLVAAARGPWRGVWRAGALGLIAGLGLADHVTCALVAPIGLLGIARGMRETRAPIAASAAVAGLVLGLSPYLYVLVAPSGDASWGHYAGLGDVLGLVLRRDYGGPLTFAASGDHVSAAQNLASLGLSLGRSWWWAPGLLGLGVLAARSVRVPRAAAAVDADNADNAEPVWGWRMLALSWVIAGPLLVLRFNLDPHGLGLYVVTRFYLLPALLLTIPVAIGLDVVGAAIAARIPTARVRWLAPAVAITAIVVAAASALPQVARVHTTAVADGIHNLLRSLPPNAIVITTPDDLDFGLAYARFAEHERPDVIAIAWPLMRYGWYVADLARRGVIIDTRGAAVPSVRAANQLLATGRPLFVDPLESHIVAAFPNYPFGLVIRVLPAGTTPPTLDEVVALNQHLYTQVYRFADPQPNAADDWAAEIHERYAATWYRLGEALRAAGRETDAEHAFGTGDQLGSLP